MCIRDSSSSPAAAAATVLRKRRTTVGEREAAERREREVREMLSLTVLGAGFGGGVRLVTCSSLESVYLGDADAPVVEDHAVERAARCVHVVPVPEFNHTNLPSHARAATSAAASPYKQRCFWKRALSRDDRAAC
eukprot:3150097-Rhodomonas_salina.5